MNIEQLIQKTIELETLINQATQQAPNLECARALERASDFLTHQGWEYSHPSDPRKTVVSPCTVQNRVFRRISPISSLC